MDIIRPPRTAYRRRQTLKTLLAVPVGLIVASIPCTLFYLLWSWCMAQIPVTLAWAGIAKIGVTLAMVLFGGGATIAFTFFLTAMALAVIIAWLD